MTRPLYFIGDKTNLRVKTGVDNFVVRYFVKSTGAHSQRSGDANTKLSNQVQHTNKILFFFLAYNTDMKTKPLQDMALKSFSPSSSSVSYTGKADGTTEVTRPLYFIEDKTNLHVKTGVDNFVVRY